MIKFKKTSEPPLENNEDVSHHQHLENFIEDREFTDEVVGNEGNLEKRVSNR